MKKTCARCGKSFWPRSRRLWWEADPDPHCSFECEALSREDSPKRIKAKIHLCTEQGELFETIELDDDTISSLIEGSRIARTWLVDDIVSVLAARLPKETVKKNRP